MSGVEAARRKDASYPPDEAAPVCESRSSSSSTSSSTSTTSGQAPASWNADYDKIGSGVQAYDESLFGNPSLVSKWPSKEAGSSNASVSASPEKKASGCTNVIPPPPPPLPPGIPKTAPNAYRTIQLTVIAENLPESRRSVFDHTLKAGNYKLYPQLARQPDGSEACVYWTAYNVNTKRDEFVVGPNHLDTFMNAPRMFENAAAAAYMNGEPNAWMRESMKTVDSAGRCGPASKEARSHLAASWLEAVKDPEWWMQNAAGAGAIAESSAAAQRRINNPPAAQIGRNSRIVEGGGLKAHEGGPANAHTIGKHVGKTPDELRARLAAEPEKNLVSTFSDRASAELAATRTLEANEARIQQWLIKAKPNSRLQLNLPGANGGTVLQRGADAPIPGTATRIVLVKDPSMSRGFRILTGYPTLD